MKKNNKQLDIKVKDFTFTIKLVDENDKTLHFEDGGEAFGITNPVNQTIVIQDNLSKERLRQVLTHEITHAFLDIYLTDSNIKGFDKNFNAFDTESICCFMGTYARDIIATSDYAFSKLSK